MTPSPREGRCPPPRPRGPPAGGDRPPRGARRASCCAPRPEAVEAGCAKVMGFDATAIHEEMLHLAGRGRPSQEPPYGTGDAAKKIVDALEGFLKK